MSGKSQTKSLSKVFPTDRLVVETIVLALLGAAAVTLRARLRIHLNMPGHHGLEVMALFMIARNFTKISFGGTIAASAGALVMLIPILGYQNPFLPASYILMGIIIDIFYAWFKNLKPAIIFFVLLGGIAYLVIPLTRLILHGLHVYPYQAILKTGIAYTLSSHFLYGATGAALAAGLIYTSRKIKKKNN